MCFDRLPDLTGGVDLFNNSPKGLNYSSLAYGLFVFIKKQCLRCQLFVLKYGRGVHILNAFRVSEPFFWGEDRV